MIQEEVDQKTIALSIKAGKLTGRVLAKALRAVLRKMKQHRNAPHHGKQTVRQLARQNAGLQNIELSDANIKSFERTARKYGVDFALKRDSKVPPRWLVFFKARDTDALTAAFTEYSRITLKRSRRPSMLETMRGFKERMKDFNHNRSKLRERSGPER